MSHVVLKLHLNKCVPSEFGLSRFSTTKEKLRLFLFSATQVFVIWLVAIGNSNSSATQNKHFWKQYQSSNSLQKTWPFSRISKMLFTIECFFREELVCSPTHGSWKVVKPPKPPHFVSAPNLLPTLKLILSFLSLLLCKLFLMVDRASCKTSHSWNWSLLYFELRQQRINLKYASHRAAVRVICVPAFNHKIGNVAQSGVPEVLFFTNSQKGKKQRRKKWKTGRLLRETMRFWRSPAVRQFKMADWRVWSQQT